MRRARAKKVPAAAAVRAIDRSLRGPAGEPCGTNCATSRRSGLPRSPVDGAESKPSRLPGVYHSIMQMDPVEADAGTAPQRFERVLSQAQFEGLKAILDRLSPDREKLPTQVLAANTYGEILAGLGYRLTVVRQIHLQDCYGRLGREGGIKAVLPYYDIPTQASLPTLINFDATVTATPKSATFFEALFLELRRQLQTQA